MSRTKEGQNETLDIKEGCFTAFSGAFLLFLFLSIGWMVEGVNTLVTQKLPPVEIRVAWIVFDIVFILLGCIFPVMAATTFDDSSDETVGCIMGGIAILVIGSIICIATNFLGVLSIVLFLVLFVEGLILFWFLFDCIKPTRKPHVNASQSDTPAPESSSPDEPHCSICKTSSEYEICLVCERKHTREIQRVRSQNWRAKKAGESATLTIAEWLDILEAFQYKCAYCQTGPYELMEHYIPIGQKTGGTTAKNCVPACRKCNAGKSNKHPEK